MGIRGGDLSTIVFRFFGVFGYGNRAWENAWVFVSREFQLSLYRKERERVLAAVAYDAWRVVPGLCLYSAWRESVQ